jgi:hypothetical protein
MANGNLMELDDEYRNNGKSIVKESHHHADYYPLCFVQSFNLGKE